MADAAAAESSSLQIYNRSSTTKSYLLCQGTRAADIRPWGGKNFCHVFDCSGDLPPGEDSEVTWTIPNKFYAIYGTSIQSGSDTVVTVSNSKKVKLGPKGSHVGIVVGSRDESVSFDDKPRPIIETMGGFGLVTNSFVFPTKKSIYMGIGAQAPRGAEKILPLQTFIAKPQLKSMLFPATIYYVAHGQYQAGTVLDREYFVRSLKVDYTYATTTAVSLYQDDKGDFYHAATGRKVTKYIWEAPGGVRLSMADASEPEPRASED